MRGKYGEFFFLFKKKKRKRVAMADLLLIILFCRNPRIIPSSTGVMSAMSQFIVLSYSISFLVCSPDSLHCQFAPSIYIRPLLI